MVLCTVSDHATPCRIYKMIKKSEDTWEHTSAPVADSRIDSLFKNCFVFTDQKILVALDYIFIILDE